MNPLVAVLPAFFAAALATTEPQLIADGGLPFVDDAPAALHAAPAVAVAHAPLPAVPLETVEVVQEVIHAAPAAVPVHAPAPFIDDVHVAAVPPHANVDPIVGVVEVVEPVIEVVEPVHHVAAVHHKPIHHGHGHRGYGYGHNGYT